MALSFILLLVLCGIGASKAADGSAADDISYDNTWTDKQCDNVGYHVGKSLSECKSKCREKEDCTAINYNAEKGLCVLRACTVPVPEPAGSAEGYRGYVISGDACQELEKKGVEPYTYTKEYNYPGYTYSVTVNTLHEASQKNLEDNNFGAVSANASVVVQALLDCYEQDGTLHEMVTKTDKWDNIALCGAASWGSA